MSVPVWGTTLSGPLPVVGLVSRYLTNYLMGRSPLPQPRKFRAWSSVPRTSCGISCRFQQLSPAEGQVSYVLRTRSPLSLAAPFDLHVLGTPPAFILSQDQTLHQLTLTRVSHRRTPASAGVSFFARAKARAPAACAWLVFSHSSVVKVRQPAHSKNATKNR